MNHRGARAPGSSCCDRSAGQARGFSLVELMIALLIGLLITGSMISVFIATRTASRTTSGVASLTDGGRVALDFLQQGIRSAGFFACNTPARTVNLLTTGASAVATDYLEPLGGFEALGSSPAETALASPPASIATVSATATSAVTPDTNIKDWTNIPTPGGTLDSMLAGLVVKGSDVLVVHTLLPQAAPNPPTVYLTAPASAGTSTVTVSALGGLVAGQVVLISNCAASVATQISSISGATVTVNPALPASFGAGTQVGVADTIVYFIGVDPSSHNSALFAIDLKGAIAYTNPANQLRELVPDIENMQILYGIDGSGNLAVTEYVTADQVDKAANAGNFNGVLAVRIAVMAASPLYAQPVNGAVSTAVANTPLLLAGTSVQPPADTRLRRVFETTVSVRNDGT